MSQQTFPHPGGPWCVAVLGWGGSSAKGFWESGGWLPACGQEAAVAPKHFWPLARSQTRRPCESTPRAAAPNSAARLGLGSSAWGERGGRFCRSPAVLSPQPPCPGEAPPCSLPSAPRARTPGPARLHEEGLPLHGRAVSDACWFQPSSFVSRPLGPFPWVLLGLRGMLLCFSQPRRRRIPLGWG